MGPIWDIYIHINKLNENLIDYTLYDVLFLSHLVNNLHKNIRNYKIINELTQLTFIDKRNIINIIPKTEINKINNYIVFIDKPYRLNELFSKFLNTIIKYNNIEKILKINYFKSTLLMIFKYEFLTYAAKNYVIYEKLSEKIKYNKNILLHKTNYLEKNNLISLIDDIKYRLNKFFSNI